MNVPISTGLYDHLDVKNHHTVAQTAAAEFNGSMANIINFTSLTFLTLPVTFFFIALDLMPTAVYASKTAMWMVSQITNWVFVTSGLSAWIMTNAGINISPAASGLNFVVVGFTALLMFMLTLTPTIAGMLFSSFAKADMPYAGLIVHMVCMFDAVTDWAMAAAMAWGGFYPLLSTLMPAAVAYWLCYPLAWFITFVNSSLLEVFCISLWIFHVKLWQNRLTSTVRR